MRFLVLLALLASAPAMALPAGASDSPEIVIRASVARAEIERILNGDNLDTIGLPAPSVADAMAHIPRGRAPADFWQAYERHLKAWENYAEAVSSNRDQSERIVAERSINTTFDAVEQIARRYGARLPAPRVK